jgi:hypothetical protein
MTDTAGYNYSVEDGLFSDNLCSDKYKRHINSEKHKINTEDFGTFKNSETPEFGHSIIETSTGGSSGGLWNYAEFIYGRNGRAQ